MNNMTLMRAASTTCLLAALALSGCVTTSQKDAAVSPLADVDVDAALAAIRAQDSSQSREPFTVVEDLVREAAKGDDDGAALASRLADLALDPEVSRECRQFCCRQLALIGTADEARRLLPLLIDPASCDDARYAVHPIPGRKADAVLRDALEAATDEGVKTALANTLLARGVKLK